MKRLLLPLLIIGLIYGVQQYQATESNPAGNTVSQTEATADARYWRSGDQVRGSGRVTRVLPDANEGSRYQRFVVIHWTHHDPRGGHVGGWIEHTRPPP